MRRTSALFLTPLLTISTLLAGDLKEEGNHYTADYVIIGSGPAGAPIAKLLTDDKKRSVILLEAGGNHNKNPLIHLSSNIQNIVFNEAARFSWLDETITQPNLNRHFDYISGRILGGASSVNGTFWLRTTNQRFAEWKKFGGKKWGVKRIDRIAKYLEHYQGDTTGKPFRGRNGPVHVRQMNTTTPTANKFAAAFHVATGYPILTDYNNPATPLGVDPRIQWSQKGINGKYRVSSATAFLNEDVMTSSGRGVHGRKLRVLTKSTALRTIWDGNRAIGVEVLKEGKFVKVFARKEVIVSAGLNSSQFLQLSGIGPKKMLKEFDIPVKFDNENVGRGLTDSAAVVAVFSANPADPAKPAGDPNSPAQVYGFLPNPNGHNPHDRVIHLVGSLMPVSVDNVTLANGFVVGVVLCDQKSTGSIRLESNDPLQMPRINLGVLTKSADLQTLIAAFQNYLLPISEQLALIDPTYQLLLPSALTIADTALLTEYIQSAVDLPSTVHNYTGHCKMAPLKKGGVVDGSGRVYGVKGMRVADCSIAPTPSDGACMQMGYIIGVNIASAILEEEREHLSLPHLD